MMKIDEIIFFINCYVLRNGYGCRVRDVVEYLEGQIPRNRCRYYLKKWAKLGFYEYSAALDLGWFEYKKMPDRYRNIINRVCYD